MRIVSVGLLMGISCWCFACGGMRFKPHVAPAGGSMAQVRIVDETGGKQVSFAIFKDAQTCTERRWIHHIFTKNALEQKVSPFTTVQAGVQSTFLVWIAQNHRYCHLLPMFQIDAGKYYSFVVTSTDEECGVGILKSDTPEDPGIRLEDVTMREFKRGWDEESSWCK